MFNGLTFDQIRAICRNQIESIEIWLRRIVVEQLQSVYGVDFLVAERDNGSNLISKKISAPITERFKNDPTRYSRVIDAALLDDCCNIICNHQLYARHFSQYFASLLPNNLPQKNEYLRHLLSSLVPIRNKLSHANPISLREAERVIGYSNDVIQALKNYYQMLGKEQEYNVPSIIRITDSFGSVYHKKKLNQWEPVNYTNDPKSVLRPGDILRIEVTVDPSFTETKILYRFGGPESDYKECNTLVYEVREHDINPKMVVHCQIKSERPWTYLSGNDDAVTFYYKVLPPVL